MSATFATDLAHARAAIVRELDRCAVEGCGRPMKTRGWCAMHYKRWRRHGNPLALGRGGQPPGEAHPMWKGDKASRKTGWSRALRVFVLSTCEHEGCSKPAVDRHHIDGNPLHNEPSNLRGLCRQHHMEEDGRA